MDWKTLKQLKNLWDKIKDNKKISDLVSWYEDITQIFYENRIYRFANLVERFREAEAFEVADLYDWYEYFTDFYNYIEDNRLIIE